MQFWKKFNDRLFDFINQHLYAWQSFDSSVCGGILTQAYRILVNEVVR